MTHRVFLVVVDDSPEMQAALRFACRRAKSSDGQVALLRVIEPTEFETFASIGNLMRAEAREAAEQLLDKLAGDVNQMSGHLPVLHVREGNPRDELIALIAEDPSISVLDLAADTGPGGPGPLVSALTGKYIGKLRVPLTLVPGGLSDEQIDAIT